MSSRSTRIVWNLERHDVELVHGRGALRRRAHRRGRAAGSDTPSLHGDVILIATGSTPFRPPDIPFDDPDVDDCDTILELDRLPDVARRSSAAA